MHRRSTDATNWAAGMIALAALAVVVVLARQVWSYSNAQRLSLRVQVLTGWDVSDTMHPAKRRRAMGVWYTVTDKVLPPRTPQRVLVYAELIYESLECAPSRSAELNQFAQKLIEKRIGRWGTLQHLPLEAMLEQVQRAPQQDFILGLFTDGENHSSSRRTTHLAAELARQRNLKAVLVGPLDEQFRHRFRQQLRPLDEAGKLIVFGMDDASRAVDELKRRLQKLAPISRREQNESAR